MNLLAFFEQRPRTYTPGFHYRGKNMGDQRALEEGGAV